MKEEPSDLKISPEVLDYLGAKSSLTLATSTPSGAPHAATLVYCSEGITLYFSIRPETRTAHNIAQNPLVAFTIDDYNPDWTRTEGIQGCGECQMLLDPAEIRRMHDLFRRKFPFLAEGPASQVRFFRIHPIELNHIHSRGRPRSAQVSLDADYHRDVVYSVFRDLPQQQADALAATLGHVQAAAGEVIVRQGAPGDKFFIIVDGEVEVVREDPQGARRITTLKRGQFFGEIALLLDRPRTASVRALQPTTLLTMERKAFRDLVAWALGTTQDFERIIEERLRGLRGPG